MTVNIWNSQMTTYLSGLWQNSSMADGGVTSLLVTVTIARDCRYASVARGFSRATGRKIENPPMARKTKNENGVRAVSARDRATGFFCT